MNIKLRKYSITALKDYKALSVIAIVLGVFGLVLNLFISNPYLVTFSPALLISGLISYTTEYRSGDFLTQSSDLGIKLLLSLHILTSALILVAFNLTGDRGNIVLLLSAALYGITALSIVKTNNLYFQLALILLTGIVIRATILFSSPVPLGNDTLFHQRMAGEISQAGNLTPLVEENSKHYDIPFYHIFVSSIIIILDLDPQASSFIGITLPSLVVPALVATWVMNRYFDSTAASISTFLVVTTDSVIRWSVTPSTTTYGFTLGVLILMAVILQRKQRIRYILLFLIVSLIFTHQTTSVITLSMVILYAIGKLLSENDTKIGIPILFFLLVIGSFLFARIDGPGGDLTVLGKLALVIGASIQLTADTGASFQIPPMINAQLGGTASLSSIQVLGPALLFLFGTTGSLSLLRSESISDDSWNQVYRLLLVAAGLFVPIFIGPLVGFTLLLPYRWFPFAYFILAMPASLGIITVSKKVSAVPSSHLILALLMISGLLMGGNYFGSYEDPVFDNDPGAIRYEYTDQEVSMFHHAAKYSTGPVRGDTVATIVVNRHFDTKTAQGLRYNYDKRGYSGTPQGTIVIDRPYAHTNHAWYWLINRGKTGSVIGELPRNALSCAEDVIYDSGSEKYNGHLLRYTRTSCY